MNDLVQQPREDLIWSEWRSLDKPSDSSGAAVYEVRIVNADGLPLPVPRMLLTDETGVLSIGEAGNMENRRRQCRDAIRKGAGHSSYNLLHYVLQHTDFRKKFTDFQLQYRYCDRTDKSTAQSLESTLIKNYILRLANLHP